VRVRLFGRRLHTLLTRKMLSICILVCLVMYLLIANFKPDAGVRALFQSIEETEDIMRGAKPTPQRTEPALGFRGGKRRGARVK